MGSYIKKAIILRHPAPSSIEYSLEVAASCEKYGIPYEFFDGYYTTDVNELNDLSGWTFPNAWVKEYCCTAGHLNIWLKAMKEDGAVAVFEHDAIVKRRMDDIHVEDGEIAFLGLRVENRNDYECPDGPVTKLPIKTFEGTHGYALTPVTARRCISIISGLPNFPCPIDGLMGIHNVISQRMSLCDPCPMIAEVGNRKSFTQFESAKYNVFLPPEFQKGLKENRFKWDESRERMVFSTEKDLWFSDPNIRNETKTFLDKLFDLHKIDTSKQIGVLDIYPGEGATTVWFSDNLLHNVNSYIISIDQFDNSKVIEKIPGDIHSRSDLKERFQYNINLSKNRQKGFMHFGTASEVLRKFSGVNDNKVEIICFGMADDPIENDWILQMVDYFLKKDGILILYNINKNNRELINTIPYQKLGSSSSNFRAYMKGK